MSKNKKTPSGPRVLILDIETSPIISYTWGIFDQNIGLNQIVQDWHLLSYSAKFLNESKIFYSDQRNEKDITNDKNLLEGIWKLMDEADVIIGQNSKSFDIKKLNARFIFHKMKPPSSYAQIDTMRLAKKHFGFTSNKLEYMTNKLCTKYKKLTHKKFPGFELWRECLAGNVAAWNEMRTYNQHDILSTEELYTKLVVWDGDTVNFNVYSDNKFNSCKCGNNKFVNNGFAYTSKAKYQRYKCKQCGSETRGLKNLLSKDKKASLNVGTKR